MYAGLVSLGRRQPRRVLKRGTESAISRAVLLARISAHHFLLCGALFGFCGPVEHAMPGLQATRLTTPEPAVRRSFLMVSNLLLYP